MPKLKNKEDIKFYYDKAQKRLSEYHHAKAGEYVELLVETCLAEREWEEGLLYFFNYIRENGLEIYSEQEDLTRLSEQIFKLRFLKKMVHATGLGVYEERILSHEIDKIFGKRTPTSQPLPLPGRIIKNV